MPRLSTSGVAKARPLIIITGARLCCRTQPRAAPTISISASSKVSSLRGATTSTTQVYRMSHLLPKETISAVTRPSMAGIHQECIKIQVSLPLVKIRQSVMAQSQIGAYSSTLEGKLAIITIEPSVMKRLCCRLELSYHERFMKRARIQVRNLHMSISKANILCISSISNSSNSQLAVAIILENRCNW